MIRTTTRILAMAFLVSLNLSFADVALAQEKSSPSNYPNIVFVLADDMGYGDASCLNKNSRIKTPHMDRLAREGMTFTDAHTGAAICTPTRYNFLTGRYAWRTKLKGVLVENSPPLIRANELTVGRFLQQLGYHTACIGKWHLGKVTSGKKVEQGPVTRGFDYFYGFQYARGIENLFENDQVAPKLKPVDVLPELTKKAVRYVDQRAKEKSPFFLYFPLNSPHTPIVPTKEFQGKSGLDAYGDFVVQSDWALGQVMEALDRNHLRDNTLIIFASDNGSPHAKGQGHDSNYIFRGKKGTIYEGGHRVPFIARWPGKIEAGTECDSTICLGDFLATCAAITKQKLPANAGVDSISFLPHLLGKSNGGLREATVHHDGWGTFALRKDQWVLIFPSAGKKKNKKATDQYQLFNLSSDVSQTKNLAKENPKVVFELTTIMQRYVDDGRSTPGPRQRNDKSVTFSKKTPPN